MPYPEQMLYVEQDTRRCRVADHRRQRVASRCSARILAASDTTLPATRCLGGGSWAGTTKVGSVGGRTSLRDIVAAGCCAPGRSRPCVVVDNASSRERSS